MFQGMNQNAVDRILSAFGYVNIHHHPEPSNCLLQGITKLQWDLEFLKTSAFKLLISLREKSYHQHLLRS